MKQASDSAETDPGTTAAWWHGMNGLVPDADAAASLEAAYRSSLAPRDLASSTTHLDQEIAAHLRAGAVRPAGRAVVRIAAAPEQGRATVMVVVDDMPFLVESLVAALRDRGVRVHSTAHPLLAVVRDEAGRLERLATADPVAQASGEGAVRESWILVGIDGPRDEQEAEGLTSRLHDVLDDVRCVVDDWQPMKERVLVLADQIDADPSGTGSVAGFLHWIADDRFTFLGLEAGEERLGLLRAEELSGPSGDRELSVTKADRRVVVHRSAYPDLVTVQVPGGGVTRILGLFSSAAQSESVRRIPVVADKVASLLAVTGFRPGSHSARDLLGVLELVPLGVLLAADPTDLLAAARDILDLDGQRRCRVFVSRHDAAGYASTLVFLPRDRYSAEAGRRIEELVRHAFGGASAESAPRLSDSSLVRLQVIVRAAEGHLLLSVDEGALERQLTRAVRSWEDGLRENADNLLGPDAAGFLLGQWVSGLPATYRAGVLAATALDDILRAEELLGQDGRPHSLALSAAGDDGAGHWRLRLIRRSPATLSELLPFVADLGLMVTDERPYVLSRSDGEQVWLYDIGLGVPPTLGGGDQVGTRKDAFRDALAAAWEGHAESDTLSRLVVAAELSWREVALLRALVGYVRQTGFPYTVEYVATTLVEHRAITGLLVELFEARLRPVERGGAADREKAVATATEHLAAELDAVTGRDADRILRTLQSAVEAILRTNYFQRADDGSHAHHLVFKLDPSKVLGIPAPVPRYEIWVHSPRVEGVHLRFGAVARGGLRWSDRREDFRTEVLGLVKAQVVKNSVIVPTGAKGGFFAKQLPDPALDRDAWLAEGQACYRTFIGGLLDVTDNLSFDGDQRLVVPPADVVRHDGDDPYLVVAADKGTATFSDIANGIAQERGFWLGDAFASGGSNGYDHKAMGITARGAWESVRRHFRELGQDPQTGEFTVVGIGDMSGDVFGNGMLLSDRIRLLAAFNHMHVFLDPDPDADRSFAERQRLFALPRSGWSDYDLSAISPGGGVYSRFAKAIPVSPQVARRLDLPEGTTSLAPDDLISAILRAPVDLLWNGGIGTYVKASGEQHADVGDRANDAIRIDGADLRVRVVGEGGNLGLTQRGRIEAALGGVLLNTDAVDNSAGVDCSDHEVNIKVALDQLVAEGSITATERNATLVRMTDDVAELVLTNNIAQNRALSYEAAFAATMLPAHRRFIGSLASAGLLDPRLEALPDEAELNRRMQDGRGLTVPELSVLLAYAKITLAAAVRDTDVPDESWSRELLHCYFPSEMRQRFADRIVDHPLRRDIATTVLVNEVIDLGGITVAFRAAEETGRPLAEVVRAFAIVVRVFGLADDFRAVAALDGAVPATVQAELWHEHQRLLDRAIRWFLNGRSSPLHVTAEMERYGATVARFAGEVTTLLRGQDREYVDALTARFVSAGVPEPARTAAQLYVYPLLDVVDAAEISGRDAADVAEAWFLLSERYGFDALLTRVSALGRADRWDVQSRAALRDDLYEVLRDFTISVISRPDHAPREAIDAWEQLHVGTVTRVRETVDDVLAAGRTDVPVLSVALRTLRTLLREL